MRTLILLLGLLLNSIVIDAQSVSGLLVDEKGNPVSFANVVLLSSKIHLLCKVQLAMNKEFSA